MKKEIDAISAKKLQVSLARYLLQLSVGERLPSVRELSLQSQTSVGSISQTLSSLEAMGAVRLDRRGWLGSYITSRSLGKLWDLVEGSPLVIAMTLPVHRRFEGLATGVKTALERVEIETYFIFIRGSHTRLKALRDNRCHAAIMSGLAAEGLYAGEEMLLSLPVGSWIGDYRLFYRASRMKDAKIMRVAVDPDSSDHIHLTELEFQDQEVSYKKAPFVQFPRLLKNGDIDAVLWTRDQEESFTGIDIQSRPLSKRTMELIGDKSLSAAFIVRKGDEMVKAVLSEAIKAEEIMEIQDRVISGELIPEY